MSEKRGQISSTLFIYISAAVILILLVWFGFSVISSMKEKHDQAVMLQFRQGLENDIDKMTARYGSSIVSAYPLPSGFDMVCLVDLKHVNSSYIDSFPIIKNSVESDAQENLFFLGKDNFETMYIKDMELLYHPYFDCIPLGADSIELKIIGTEYGAAVQTPAREEYCRNAAAYGDPVMCESLDIFLFKGYSSDCCRLYGYCCGDNPSP